MRLNYANYLLKTKTSTKQKTNEYIQSYLKCDYLKSTTKSDQKAVNNLIQSNNSNVE